MLTQLTSALVSIIDSITMKGPSQSHCSFFGGNPFHINVFQSLQYYNANIIRGLSGNLAVYFPCSNSNYLIVPASGWVF